MVTTTFCHCRAVFYPLSYQITRSRNIGVKFSGAPLSVIIYALGADDYVQFAGTSSPSIHQHVTLPPSTSQPIRTHAARGAVTRMRIQNVFLTLGGPGGQRGLSFPHCLAAPGGTRHTWCINNAADPGTAAQGDSEHRSSDESERAD